MIDSHTWNHLTVCKQMVNMKFCAERVDIEKLTAEIRASD